MCSGNQWIIYKITIYEEGRFFEKEGIFGGLRRCGLGEAGSQCYQQRGDGITFRCSRNNVGEGQSLNNIATGVIFIAIPVENGAPFLGVSLKVGYVKPIKVTRDTFGRSQNKYSGIGPSPPLVVDFEAVDWRGYQAGHVTVVWIKEGQMLTSLRT
ncbi:hypothetical protein TNCV_615361 [Trichonephila clavipes]|nr:hypothetical protein TNCV_615361 [Trichonephila clavipes]